MGGFGTLRHLDVALVNGSRAGDRHRNETRHEDQADGGIGLDPAIECAPVFRGQLLVAAGKGFVFHVITSSDSASQDDASPAYCPQV